MTYRNKNPCLRHNIITPKSVCQPVPAEDIFPKGFVSHWRLSADGRLFPQLNLPPPSSSRGLHIYATALTLASLKPRSAPCLWNVFPLKGIFKANTSAITIISPKPRLTAVPHKQTCAGWHKQRLGLPLSSPPPPPPPPLHWVPTCSQAMAARGNYFPSPVWGLSDLNHQ